MRPFHVCIHDATPAWEQETRSMLRDLAPLVGRRLSLGVVPDWHGAWPLTAHPGFCRLVQEASAELLLHGCVHRRRRGAGPVTWLTAGSDEMNGLDAAETQRILERGQSMFRAVFGAPARGFLAPGWQRGRVRAGTVEAGGPEYVLGYFTLDSADRRVRLATWTWDCGRWAWTGHIGQGLGRLRQSLQRGVPVLAIHPADLARGFWPRIVGLTRALIESGYEPVTLATLLEEVDVEAGV